MGFPPCLFYFSQKSPLFPLFFHSCPISINPPSFLSVLYIFRINIKNSGPIPFPGHPCFFRPIFIPFSPFRCQMPPGQLFCIGKDTAGFSHKYPYVFRIIWQFSLQIPSVFIIIPHSCPNPIRKSYWIHSDISTMISHRREDKGSALLPPCIRMLTNSYLLSMRQEVLS